MVQGKPRGRPPLDPGVAKRASFNTRLRPALKLALETAAKQEGRSLSEEIEFRLERSLDDERHLADALELGFGRQVAGLMLAIGYVIKEAVPARRPGELGWLSSPEAFREIVEVDQFIATGGNRPRCTSEGVGQPKESFHDEGW